MVAMPVGGYDAVDLVNGDMEGRDITNKRERIGSGVEQCKVPPLIAYLSFLSLWHDSFRTPTEEKFIPYQKCRETMCA
jgi:hypothetical protein